MRRRVRILRQVLSLYFRVGMRCGSVSSRPGTGFEVKAVPQDDFLAFPILSTTLFLAPEATTVRLLLEHGASSATPGPAVSRPSISES